MRGILHSDRTVLRLGGADVRDFLQGLISNDIAGIDAGLIYAALLSPQGKYLFDFFLLADGDTVLLDVKSDRAQALAQRLTLYKLRADVTIEATELAVVQVLEGAPQGAFADPRDAALGMRMILSEPPDMVEVTPEEWTQLRVQNGIPETGIELVPDETFLLEAGFEALNGVDFRKGCYVGQEVTARMKHKTELRKGLVRVVVSGAAPEAGSAVSAEGKPAGTLYSVADGMGLAHLRFDRAQGEMAAGDARLRLYEVPSG